MAAIGTGGKNIKAADARKHIWGYAIGLDMTRRDLQGEMKKQGRPWCIGKGFDESAPIGPITPAAQAGDVANAEIWVKVNGQDRQRSTVAKLIWNIGEIIEHVYNAGLFLDSAWRAPSFRQLPKSTSLGSSQSVACCSSLIPKLSRRSSLGR